MGPGWSYTWSRGPAPAGPQGAGMWVLIGMEGEVSSGHFGVTHFGVSWKANYHGPMCQEILPPQPSLAPWQMPVPSGWTQATLSWHLPAHRWGPVALPGLTSNPQGAAEESPDAALLCPGWFASQSRLGGGSGWRRHLVAWTWRQKSSNPE